MNKTLFEFMPSKALITLVEANNIREKSFGNPEWQDAYSRFVRETNYRDIDSEKFSADVKEGFCLDEEMTFGENINAYNNILTNIIDSHVQVKTKKIKV